MTVRDLAVVAGIQAGLFLLQLLLISLSVRPGRRAWNRRASWAVAGLMLGLIVGQVWYAFR